MKAGKFRKSKAAVALMVIAVLLFASGGFMGARAQLNIQSQQYEGQFELDHLAVALLENGNPTAAQESALLGDLEGSIQPGMLYKEEIAARNTTDIDHYLRLTIRKYWIKDGVKDQTKDPALIHLYFDEEGSYNQGPWQVNDKETTAEQTVYYYTSKLKGNTDTEPVVNTLKVDGSVLDDVTIERTPGEKAGETIITYHYDYDGYDICVEADVQALQTHNINHAIRSIWGVRNVSVSGNTLRVR